MPSRRHIRDIVGVRCRTCLLRVELCLCKEIPKLHVETKLIILMHAAETKSTSNTGRLAAQVFENAEVRVRGRKGEIMQSADLVVADRQTLLLYPDDDAVELNVTLVKKLKGPFTLIVPDGTWRQASKVARREPALAQVKKIKLAAGKRSEYQLRVAPQERSLSTMEAIARTMGVLEGQEVQDALEKLFKLFVTRSLWSRGMLPLSKCGDAIPTAAIEAHKLRSSHKKES